MESVDPGMAQPEERLKQGMEIQQIFMCNDGGETRAP